MLPCWQICFCGDGHNTYGTSFTVRAVARLVTQESAMALLTVFEGKIHDLNALNFSHV